MGKCLRAFKSQPVRDCRMLYSSLCPHYGTTYLKQDLLNFDLDRIR